MSYEDANTPHKSSIHIHEQSVIETRQSKATMPEDNSLFPRGKEELPQAGFQPATFCVLGRHSTN